MHDGAEFLDQQAAARPKVVRAKSYQAKVEQLWTDGLPRGSLTGWPSLDQYYTWAMDPGHGLSEHGQERICGCARGKSVASGLEIPGLLA